MRRVRLLPVAFGVLVILAGAAPDTAPRGSGTLPPEYARFLDSLLALPDSAWMPDDPRLNRRAARALYERMRRAPDSMYAGPDAAHRSDAEMALAFLRHERAFEALLAMFLADTAYERVDVRDTSIYDMPSKLPPERQAAYERLMRPIGVRILLRDEPGTILFRATTVYTFDRKGYLWSRTPIRDVAAGETTSEEYRYEFRVRRALKGGWYLYFQSSS